MQSRSSKDGFNLHHQMREIKLNDLLKCNFSVLCDWISVRRGDEANCVDVSSNWPSDDQVMKCIHPLT